MPVSMPYHLEVGHSLRALERVLNHPASDTRRTLRAGALTDLSNPAVAVDQAIRNLAGKYQTLVGAATATSTVPDQNVKELTTLADRIAKVWLTAPGTAPVAPHVDRIYDSAVLDANPLSTDTGWRFYRGQVEGIIRRTMRFAIEAASELDDGYTTGITKSTPAWPIAFSWKCAQPWFEGWVQWRTHMTQRWVLVVFCTPADGNSVAMKPTLGYQDATANDPNSPRSKAEYDGFTTAPKKGLPLQEMVVITESAHQFDASVAMSTKSTMLATIGGGYGGAVDGAPWPWFGGKFGFTPDAAIVVVAPAVLDGGV